jgi:hypothetical protein
MAKKFFLRKSHSDLVQEQNRMLQTLLDQQKTSSLVTEPPQTVRSNNEICEEESQNEVVDDSISFDFDDDMDDIAPYIHINTTDSAAQLHGVETDKVNFDEENVEKLKKARRSKRN